MRDGLVEMSKDIVGQSLSADGCVGVGCIVDEIKGECICKSAKLEELLGSEIIVDRGVVDVSDVEIVEDVVSVIEPDLAGGEVSLEERRE